MGKEDTRHGRPGATRDIGVAGASAPAAIGPGKTTLTGALGGPVAPTAGGHGAPLGPGGRVLSDDDARLTLLYVITASPLKLVP